MKHDSLIDDEHGGGMVIPFRGNEPQLGEGVFLAPTSVVIGQARLARRSSIWYGSIVRADIARIEVGEETNIQDLTLMHVGDKFPCLVGARCVVGHRAILHGCVVEDETLIGMGAILLNGSKVGRGSIVAAGALVPEGKEIPPGSLVMGSPGKIVREVSAAQIEGTLHFARKYADLGGEYVATLKKLIRL